MALRSLVLQLLLTLLTVRAVTVYNQQPIGQQLSTSLAGTDAVTTASGTSSPAASSTDYKAYDITRLTPPNLPDPLPATQFPIQLQNSASNVPGLSIFQSGAFFGFSIETSVINQVLGKNSSFIQVPFLNLVSLIAQRAGRFHIRVGGNTQETARYVESTADGRMIEKQGIDPNNPTATPSLVYTMELFYLLANISSLVNVKWYLGVPLNDTSDLRLEIAEYGQAIIGDNLIGLQIGNEPDLYLRHGHRADGYGPSSYFDEFGQVVQAMQSNSKINKLDYLIGPSIAHADWTGEQVWDTNFVPSYSQYLGAITVENYPSDNCAALYTGAGTLKVPQDEYYKYLSHDAPNSGKSLINKFMNSSAYVQSQGKPFIMFETNTASCGGFPGISNSFGSGLWALDYGLQMAYSNFSHALLHIGGQDVYYNPCTPPPTAQSTYHQWTVGPIMYAILAVSEALGSSNQSQVIDLFANSNNAYTPAYAIYERGTLARVALFNYMTDSSGANDYTVSISVGGTELGQPNGTPSQVKVKYLRASSVSDHFNITWAGQTFGGQFEADGRLKGEETIETINCDQTTNICAVKVPAPGFALVFLTDVALQESSPSSPTTFATTAQTKTMNTATVDSEVLATSNGHSGRSRHAGSTSKGSANGAGRMAGIIPGLTAWLGLLAGGLVFVKTL